MSKKREAVLVVAVEEDVGEDAGAGLIGCARRSHVGAGAHGETAGADAVLLPRVISSWALCFWGGEGRGVEKGGFGGGDSGGRARWLRCR